MHTNDDGTLTLDFFTDTEAKKVKVRPPNVGQLQRLREELYKIDESNRAQVDAWKADGLEDDLINRQTQTMIEDKMVGWWALVLLGEPVATNGSDPFGHGLAMDGLPTNEPKLWPAELATFAAERTAMAHWQAVPLLYGGSLAPTEPVPPQ